MTLRKVMRSALCWGDTSTFHDYATRILTISDGASMLCFPPQIASANPLKMPWVFRSHSAAFHAPLDSVHNEVADVEAIPKVVHVGKSSWRFQCDIVDPSSQRPLASTRGTFVLVDETLTHSTPIPAHVADALRGEMSKTDESPGSSMAQFEALDAAVAQRPPLFESAQSQEQSDPIRVRATDADALGHVNNAKWGLLIAEALHQQGNSTDVSPPSLQAPARLQPRAMSIDFLGQAKPGDLLRCRLVTDGGTTHLSFQVAEMAVTHATILQ